MTKHPATLTDNELEDLLGSSLNYEYSGEVKFWRIIADAQLRKALEWCGFENGEVVHLSSTIPSPE